MNTNRLVSVLGLGFGDCGKGLFTDFLCRRLNAHTVVRFNGGAQAGHNVVTPDGRHHTFSQFGAGTLVPGTMTLLGYPVVVHPGALLVENACLQRLGVADALQRLVIDARCRITTPFHQAAGRLRELQRGAAAHGSCGVGVGETVRHALAHPGQALCYGELLHPATALAKLEALRRVLRSDFDSSRHLLRSQRACDQELALLDDPSVSRRWLEQTGVLLRASPPAPRERVADCLQRSGAVVFEGAQGILLDEWRGFHPHTTWSSTGAEGAEAVAADAGLAGPVHHYGALRTYMTRHGNGPLPTHDPRLDHLAEPHNAAGGWQGIFRRGHPDRLLLRYALAVASQLDGLLVSHLDVFEREPGLHWCAAYEAGTAGSGDICGRDAGSGLVTSLRPSGAANLAHQALLTELLHAARPRYTQRPVGNADQFVDELESLAGLPVMLGSWGPTHAAVRALARLPD